MSYCTRVYRNRNPHSHDESAKEPFFSKQNDINKSGQRSAFFQAKLSVNEPGDKYEKEADSVANTVLNNRVPGSVLQQKRISNIQRLATSLEDEKLSTNDARMERDKEIQEKKINDPKKEEKDKMKTSPVQAKHDSTSTAAPSGISSKVENSSGKGNSLPQKTLHEMNSSFGVNFSGVKIHNDTEAVNMNNELQAEAFTHGSDIYFNQGKYNPENSKGKFLLAHELTHVIQQKGINDLQKKESNSIQMQPVSKTGGALPVALPPGSGTTSCGKPSHCPSPFCSPFPAKFLAEQARNNLGAGLLAGIAAFVSPRVVPLWAQYLAGGTSPQNLSSTFGADFTASDTTKDATKNLMTELKSELTSSPPVFPSGSTVVVLSLSSLIPSAIADLDTTGSGAEMNFSVIGEIPGNIAGGIGKTQLSCPIGARPSPFDDSRSASGSVVVSKNPGGDLTVIPSINFSVKDTIDLCPGDCGALKEQAATIPMSMMEASGVAGDVPFNVDFAAPAAESSPFNIPAPAPAPVPAPRFPGRVKVRAKPHLRIREFPNTSSAIFGNYPDGAEIIIICVSDGEDVFGNKKWGKTDKGFVSDFYLNHLDSNTPPDC